MFRHGHLGAFRHIYLGYYRLIFAYGCRITNDPEVVKDCIQELFISLHKSRDLSQTSSIKYYLFRALRWKIYRILERNKRIRSLQANYLGFEMDYEEPHETLIIENQAEEINKKRLKAALTNLTVRQREALYYYYDQNLSYQQVAEIMKLSRVKSARNLIYGSLKRLRKAI